MTPFADSSALVKLYADEPGADRVRATSTFVVSALARVEVPAALWRKVRRGELEASDAAVLVAAFEADWAAVAGEDLRHLLPVAVSAALLVDAARLTSVHGLRAYDAVQLASALAARQAAPEVYALLCFDAQLTTAAAAEGFADRVA